MPDEQHNWVTPVTTPVPYVDRMVERERQRRYQELGIDPLHPNPDGSDNHMMDAIDEELRRPFMWPEHLPKDLGMIDRLKRDILDIERGIARSEWDEKRLPCLKSMLTVFEGSPV